LRGGWRTFSTRESLLEIASGTVRQIVQQSDEERKRKAENRDGEKRMKKICGKKS
jgi:hypothetical protein